MTAGRRDGDSIARELERLVEEVADAVGNLIGGGGASVQEERLLPVDEERLRSTIWDLRRLLRTAMGNGGAEEFTSLLVAVDSNREEVERSLALWFDLIESLVQGAESRYGHAPGRGGLKAAEVREVVRRLLTASRFRVPGAAAPLRPIAIDIITDWTVDAVVLALNRYGMWLHVDPAPASVRGRIATLVRRVGLWLRPLAAAPLRFVAWLWTSTRVRTPLPPEVAAAVAAIENARLLQRTDNLAATAIDLVEWAATHRRQVVAALELVFAAVHEAEQYAELDGPRKKAFARALVFAVLADMGWAQQARLLTAAVASIVNGTIRGSVQLFHKRGVFPPHSDQPIPYSS